MGSWLSRSFVCDHVIVHHTLLCIATGQTPIDILTLTTSVILEETPEYKFKVDYLESVEDFKAVLKSYKSPQKTLIHLGTVCAFTVLYHKKNNIPLNILANIICDELELPWRVKW